MLLARDVEALVLDPCFRGSPVEGLAHQLPCPVEWHAGFRWQVEVLLQHPDYRGAAIAALGAQIARSGVLTPNTIGAAMDAAAYDLQALARYGDLSQVPAA